MIEKPNEPAPQTGHPEWFRTPTPREHRMGARLFVSFGLFFVALFFVERDWGFRWVLLALGVISLLRGVYHWIRARQKNEPKR